MTFVKIDRPRRIEEFIDYFGERRRAAMSGPEPYRGVAVNLRQPNGGEAA